MYPLLASVARVLYFIIAITSSRVVTVNGKDICSEYHVDWEPNIFPKWDGVCVSGSLQSPINLPLLPNADAERIELNFNDKYHSNGSACLL